MSTRVCEDHQARMRWAMSACGVYVHRDGDFSIFGAAVREERTPMWDLDVTTLTPRCELGCRKVSSPRCVLR